MATQRGRRRLPGKPLDFSMFLGGNLLRPPPRRDFAVLLGEEGSSPTPWTSHLIVRGGCRAQLERWPMFQRGNLHIDTMLPTMKTLTPAAIATGQPPFSLLGVRVRNVTQQEAIAMLEKIIEHHDSWAASVFFVNAHTLNVATADPAYREILNAANLVFADGTGVRWAARLQGVQVVENLTGTDLVPAWFRATFDRGHSCFLLGPTP